MAIPLFILGKNRSGTTWLANQLCQHRSIAGVCHEAHQGIHESAFFNRIYGRFGDLRVKSNYIEFVEVFGSSDYAILGGVKKKELYSFWPTEYETVFRKIMDQYASRNHAKYWLEKSPGHTPCLHFLARAYPDALFIGIKRDLTEVLASTLHTEEKRNETFISLLFRQKLLLKTVWLHVYYNRLMDDFAKRSDRLKLISFSELKRSPKIIFQDICVFLGLQYDQSMVGAAYKKNSSFNSFEERERALGGFEKVISKIMAALVKSFFPVSLMSFIYKCHGKFKRRKPLPPWFFKIYEGSVRANSTNL